MGRVYRVPPATLHASTALYSRGELYSSTALQPSYSMHPLYTTPLVWVLEGFVVVVVVVVEGCLLAFGLPTR